MAKKTVAPPGGWEQYIRDIKASVITKYEGRNRKMADVYERRFMKKAPYVPPKFKRQGDSDFRSPLIYDVCLRMDAILGAQMPEPEVTPIKVGPNAQKNSSLREDWFRYSWQRMFSEVYPKTVDAMVSTGLGVYKVIIKKHKWGELEKGNNDPDYLTAYEEGKRKVFPFRAEHVPPDTYYPISGDEDGVAEVMEISQREARPIAWMYGLKVNQGGKLSKIGDRTDSFFPSTCEFVEYWNRTHVVYMVDGEVVKVVKHNYGRTPYYTILASVVSSPDPADQVSSFVFPLLSIQDTIDSFTAIQKNWAYLTGYPSAKLEPLNEDAIDITDLKTEIAWEPGGTTKAPLGYRWDWVSPPPVGADLTGMRNYLTEISEKLTLAPILYGNMDSRTSNAALTSLVALAKSLFAPSLLGFCKAFNETASWMQYAVENIIGEPVPIFHKENKEWMELGPKDIDGYYQVEHNLEAIIPAERMAKSVWLADLQARGAVSMKRLRQEGVGLPKPEEEQDEVDLENLEKRPEFTQLLMQEFLEFIKANQEPPIQPMEGMPPPAEAPIGPGGPGAQVLPGVQQPAQPGGSMPAR